LLFKATHLFFLRSNTIELAQLYIDLNPIFQTCAFTPSRLCKSLPWQSLI